MHSPAGTRPALAARAAIFALDGTIVDSEPGAQAALRRLFEGYAVPYDEALLRRFVGRRGPEVFAELDHLFPGHDPHQLSAEVGRHYVALDLPPASAFPGAVALLRRVKQRGERLGLVTSGRRRYAVPRLEQLGLADAFGAIVTADDVSAGKPDPEGCLLASRELGVAPACCVVFEDSPAGVAAAKSAGMHCVAVTTTHEAAQLGAADRVVADLAEVDWPVLLADAA
ncbi:MAG TPA: HAD family phosphatase [Streptosporangiaceae bacterium]